MKKGDRVMVRYGYVPVWRGSDAMPSTAARELEGGMLGTVTNTRKDEVYVSFDPVKKPGSFAMSTGTWLPEHDLVLVPAEAVVKRRLAS